MADKEFSIRGFVKNEGKDAPFTLQRSIPPGAKLAFEDAFLVAGKKSGKNGKAFVEWLRENVFPGPEWGFYSDEGVPFFSETTAAKQDPAPEAPLPAAEAQGAGRVMRRARERGPEKGSKITPAAIIEATGPAAKDLITACNDKSVLKKAMSLTKHFAGKEEHMRYLMRRLEQVG